MSSYPLELCEAPKTSVPVAISPQNAMGPVDGMAVHALQRNAFEAMARDYSRAHGPDRLTPGRSAVMIALLSLLGWSAVALVLI